MGRELDAVRQPGSYAARNKEEQKARGQEGKLFNNNRLPSCPLALLSSIITIIILSFSSAFAEELPMSALVTPTNVDFKICTRNYIMPEEKLFYMAIAAARANNFEVNEIQSKTGYILFTAAGKQYLASVLKTDAKNSMLKITPVNNNYFFAPGIVLNFFRYIDLNGATPIVELPKV